MPAFQSVSPGADTLPLRPDAPHALHTWLDLQRRAFQAEPYPSLAVRRSRVARLGELVKAHADTFVASISADFGHRSAHETRLAELLVVEAAARHTQRHLPRWMAERKAPTALHFLPGHNRLLRQPLGVVGVVSPWNYPVQLALAPALAALAAGNRVLLKPSELSPHTSLALARAVAQFFAPDEFTVVTGGADVGQAFCSLPLDHLFFTGSTAVGRQVAQLAAAQLTPVTLELGGKSPAIVHASADLPRSAARLAYGKLLNAGQTCVAPDHVWVPRDLLQPFTDLLAEAMQTLYPSLAANPDYSCIINTRHQARLQALLDDAQAQGARLRHPHRERPGALTRKFRPTLVLGATPGMRLMQEEIFGPILPVLPYDDDADLQRQLQAGERPLALYWFGQDAAAREQLLRHTHAGGVTVNDCLWHLGQEEQPFGGVGASGHGAYHGEWGFRTFSHEKPVFHNPGMAGTDWLRPPYGAAFERLMAWLQRLT